MACLPSVFCAPLVGVVVVLCASTLIAWAFSSWFLVEALELDVLASHFQHTETLPSLHRYTALLLLVAALAVELLRRVIRWGERRADYSWQVPGQAITVADDVPPPPSSAKATEASVAVCEASTTMVEEGVHVPEAVVLAVPEGHSDRTLTCVYIAGTVGLFLVLLCLACVFFVTGVFWSYPFFNWEHGVEEQMRRTWRDLATPDGHASPLCAFMEAHHCTGCDALCPYDGAILPTPTAPPASANCPSCDFSAHGSKFVRESERVVRK